MMVVGDQEVWKLLWEAKSLKYGWVFPWPGSWHLMLHSLDVVFRKWAGIGIVNLAKAARCHNKKLDSGDFHKRHFVLMAATKALWEFCLGELENNGKVGIYCASMSSSGHFRFLDVRQQ